MDNNERIRIIKNCYRDVSSSYYDFTDTYRTMINRYEHETISQNQANCWNAHLKHLIFSIEKLRIIMIPFISEDETIKEENKITIECLESHIKSLIQEISHKECLHQGHIKMMHRAFDDFRDDQKSLNNENDLLKTENETLKKEKKWLLDLRKALLENLKVFRIDKQKLREKNELLDVNIKVVQEAHREEINKVEDLKEEVEKLKQENEKHFIVVKNFKRLNENLTVKNNRLKEENQNQSLIIESSINNFENLRRIMRDEI